jgi:hypothetical protein
LILVVACRHPIHLDIDTDDWQERAIAERAETVRLAGMVRRTKTILELLRGPATVGVPDGSGPETNDERDGSSTVPVDVGDATGALAAYEEGPRGPEQLDIGF